MSAQTIAIERAEVSFPVRGGLLGTRRGEVRAVDGVSLALHENETVALVGESGSGKTTLGMAALGLRPLTAGTVAWRGRPLSHLTAEESRRHRRDVQVVFQDPYGSLNPRQTVETALRRPLDLHATLPAAERAARIVTLLDRVGLRPAQAYTDRYPHEFSGGQRQRIAIARALVLDPTVLIADEPVSALDVSIRAQILNLLRGLKQELRLSMLFLSHDLGVVRFIADRVAVMYRGRLVEVAPVDAIFRRSHHPYTKALLAAAPSLRGGAGRPALPPPGPSEPRAAADLTVGCRYRTRCPFAFARCQVEDPALRMIAAGHDSACHLDS